MAQNSTALNLPLLRPDETLYSWCGAVHAINGTISALATSQSLFGAPYAALLHDFPSHLATLFERTSGELGESVDIAVRHTLLGYYIPFAPKYFARPLVTTIQRGSAGELKRRMGISAVHAGTAHPLKACAICMEEDFSLYGASFWRVSHQYPSSYICCKHQHPLSALRMKMTPVHQRRWLLPDLRYGELWQRTPVVNAAQMTQLTKLTEFSRRVSCMSPGSYDARVAAQTYRMAFSRLGMVTRHGRLRIDAVGKWIRDGYAGLERYPGLEVLASIRPGWPGFVALSRKTPRRGHPCKHLLLICALFDSWDDFENHFRAARENCPPSEDEYLEEVGLKGDTRLAMFAGNVARGMSVSAAAKAVGVTPTTGVRWANLQGIEFTSRAKYLRPRLLNTVRTLLAEGQPKPKVCKRTGISRVSLDRLLSAEPKLAAAWRNSRFDLVRSECRRRFLSLLADHPAKGISEIRRMPANGYAWLYGHDHAWLKTHVERRVADTRRARFHGEQ
jgi:hypothetical protein